MASSAVVMNIAPAIVQNDLGAKTKQKAAENASKADEIQHGREMKMANSSRQKVEKSNNILEHKKEDIETKQEKVDHAKFQEEVAIHDLKMSRDDIQQKLDSTLKEHQRQKENMEREHSQKIKKMNLDHIKIVEDHRRETVAMKEKLDDKMEDLTVQIGDFIKKVEGMDIELTKLGANHKAAMEKMEMELTGENEEKIKQIVEDNEQELVERDLAARKLNQEKNELMMDLDELKDEHENDVLQKNHENNQALNDAIDEENENWRNKMNDLRREARNMERMLQDDITDLEMKLRDELLETDGKWKLKLQQKQIEKDLMEIQLNKQIYEAKENAKDLKAKLRQRSVDNMNELKIKLNKKAMELKEEHQKEVEEAVNKEINSFKNQMDLQEKKYFFEIEKTKIDFSTKEDALTRALARKSEVEEKLREAERAVTKATLKKITENEARRSENFYKTFKMSRPTGFA